jgi:hypothetical protein
MDILTKKDICKIFTVTGATIERWQKNGMPYLQPKLKDGKSKYVRYSLPDVMNWMRQNATLYINRDLLTSGELRKIITEHSVSMYGLYFYLAEQIELHPKIEGNLVAIKQKTIKLLSLTEDTFDSSLIKLINSGYFEINNNTILNKLHLFKWG